MSGNNNLDHYYKLLKIPNDSSLEFIEGAYGFFKANPTEDAVYNQKEIAFQKILAQKKPKPAVSFELEDVENGFTNVSKVGQTTKNSNQQQEQKIRRTQSQHIKTNDISIDMDELSKAFNEKFGTEPNSSGTSRTSSIRGNNFVSNDTGEQWDKAQFNKTKNDELSKVFKPEGNEANKPNEPENPKPKEEEKPNEGAKRPEFRKKSSLHPRQLKKPNKNPAIEQKIFLTPEEILNGCNKEVKVSRKMEIIGKEWVDDKTFSVEINPGVAIDTRITFEQEGHRNMKALPGDVVFIIKDKPNETFEQEKAEKEQNSFSPNSFKKENTMKNAKLENALITKHDIWISLDNVLKGCKKKIQIRRKQFENELTKFEDKTVEVDIKPGIATDAQILLKQEGDQLPDGSFGDAVFIVHDEKHPQLERLGPDIKYVAKVSQKQLNDQVEIEIPALENGIVNVKLDEKVAENMNKCFYGKGLPYPGSTRMRGNLNVEFKIVSDNEAKEIVLKAQDKPQTKPKETKTKNKNDFNETKENPSPNKLPPNEFEIKLTLEEMFRGCVKKEKITRKIVHGKGNQEDQELTLSVIVEPGSIPGTKINVDGEGDRHYAKTPANVIFTVVEEPHSIFKRDGHDIVYMAKITSQEAILGCKLNIPTLKNIPEHIELEGGITPNTIRLVKNYGLPYLNKPDKRGNLQIKFDIIFEKDKIQDAAVETDLPLTLDEILHGTVKKSKITRKIKNGTDEKILTIDVKPGTLEGTKFTFPREGNQKPGQIPADVIFIVRDAPHKTFKRNGVDIEYIAEISNDQLVNGGKLEIPTLEKSKKAIYIDGIVVGKTVKRISGQGLPHPENPSKRGDILVHFKLSKIKDEDIERYLPLTLENILSGCTKRLKINRKYLGSRGEEKFEDKIIEIDIKPGTVEGTKFRFENYGDENPDAIPADIIFITQDKPTVNFTRNGTDILHTVIIAECEIEKGIQIEIPTLENNIKMIKIDKFFDLKNPFKFPNLGLPKSSNTQLRGDLIVNFKTVPNNHKDPDMEHKLSITLENVLHGCIKKVKLKRSVFDFGGNAKDEEEVIQIEIKPGTEVDKKIIFSRKGDKRPDFIPGDVIFTVKDKIHEVFTRRDANLEYMIKILESQASKINTFQIPTLEGDLIELKTDRVKKDTIQTLYGKGLPYSHSPTLRGNIVVKFDIMKETIKDQNQNHSSANNFYSKKENLHQPPRKENDQKQRESKNLNQEDPEIKQENSETSFKYNKSTANNDLENSQKNQNPKQQVLDYPIYRNVELTLNEIYQGCTKIVNFTRETVDKHNYKTFEIQSFSLKIKPGIENNEQIKFEGHGHRNFGRVPGDLIFVIKNSAHADFMRNGPDLYYKVSITENEAVNGCFSRRIPTLKKDFYYPLYVNIPVNDKSVEILKNYGLPYSDDPSKRGNIVVNFEIFGLSKANSLENLVNASVKINTEDHEAPPSTSRTDNQSESNKAELPQNPPIEIKFPVTLENILYGHTQSFQLDQIRVIEQDGTVKQGDKKIEVTIKPGTKFGTRIVFEKQGNQFHGKTPADVVFIVDEIPHKIFTRNGIDIEYTAQINSKQTLNGCQIDIPSLEKEPISLSYHQPIDENTRINIKNRGLPFIDGQISKRGNLIVRFDIQNDSYDDFYKQKSEKVLSKESIENPKFQNTENPKIESNNEHVIGRKDEFKSEFEHSRNESEQTQNPVDGNPKEVSFEVPLEDIMKGGIMKKEIQRVIIDSDGTEKTEYKIIKFKIKPGEEKGARLRFGGYGDIIYPNKTPGDVVLIIQDKPHRQFQRDGVDLLYQKKISPTEAKFGFELKILTLENKMLNFPIKEEIAHGQIMPFDNEGLPYPENPTKRGQLKVTFYIYGRKIN